MRMKGLRYQLKSVLKDKFCLMTFLLPIVVAAALNFVGSIDFSKLGEFHFGILSGDLAAQNVVWLERYGAVTAYPTEKELFHAVNEPSTNLIGVEAAGNGIKTFLSGDELDLFRQTAETLPTLFKLRESAGQAEIQILERPDIMAGYQDMFITTILIVAMFMGCTFNAMNMISEKENGVALVNEILPMARSRYINLWLLIINHYGLYLLSAFPAKCGYHAGADCPLRICGCAYRSVYRQIFGWTDGRGSLH